jgi:hypothetical protein
MLILEGSSTASETTMEPRKEYDPLWPFPQYDENGKQLLPADWNKRPTRAQEQDRMLEDVGEALL